MGLPLLLHESMCRPEGVVCVGEETREVGGDEEVEPGPAGTSIAAT